jgi:acyl carrier protein
LSCFAATQHASFQILPKTSDLEIPMTTTFSRIQKILVDDYNANAGKLTPKTALEDLAIDSLGMIELFYKLEDEFKIAVETEPTGLKTLADVVDYVDELVGQMAANQVG